MGHVDNGRGAYAEFLIGGSQPGARSKAIDWKRRTHYRSPWLFWIVVSIQHCVKTTALKLELDYLQNKLNNARTAREYNNNALQRNVVVISCIVIDNQVMNDQCKIEYNVSGR